MQKITIITPSYNQGHFIEQTIESVLSQGYDNLEYLIIDGGSTDQTVDIIKKHQKHLKYWVSEPDNGQSDAINKGLKLATGDIVNWLNSDDYYDPDTLKCVNELMGDKNNVVGGKSRIVDDKGYSKMAQGTFLDINNHSKTIGYALIDQPSTFFRRSVFDKLTPLNEQLHYLMDRYIWLKYLLNYDINQVSLTDQVFTNFRLHESSKTISETKGFNLEREFIFLSMARFYGLDNEAAIIANLPSVDYEQDLWWPDEIAIEMDVLRSAFHYYMLHLADESYFNGFSKQCRKLINHIDRNSLTSEDRSYLNSIKLKNHIPSGLRKKLRA